MGASGLRSSCESIADEVVLVPVVLLELGVGCLQRLRGQLPLGDVADDRRISCRSPAGGR